MIISFIFLWRRYCHCLCSRQRHSYSPQCLSPWTSSPALQQFLRFGTRLYIVTAINYVSKHHKTAL